MEQITINVPDNYPRDRLKEKVQKLETDLLKEVKSCLTEEESNRGHQD